MIIIALFEGGPIMMQWFMRVLAPECLSHCGMEERNQRIGNAASGYRAAGSQPHHVNDVVGRDEQVHDTS